MAATYVLHTPGHAGSEEMAWRALASCLAVDQPAQLFGGFNGMSGTVLAPSHLEAATWIPWIKNYDGRLSPTQLACAFSHISLWANCMSLDRPIAILEHDAVMLRPYRIHRYPNTIAHLGWAPDPGPVNCLAGGGNWHFIGGAHAYAIDPLVAHRLFALVLDRGLYAPLDVMIRLADFAIIPENGHAELRRGQSTVDSDMEKADRALSG